jgi:hypothetical protein
MFLLIFRACSSFQPTSSFQTVSSQPPSHSTVASSYLAPYIPPSSIPLFNCSSPFLSLHSFLSLVMWSACQLQRHLAWPRVLQSPEPKGRTCPVDGCNRLAPVACQNDDRSLLAINTCAVDGLPPQGRDDHSNVAGVQGRTLSPPIPRGRKGDS